MSSFELQTYKNGIWSIDSYYDDRDLAISEAERLDVSGRHAGVRVLLEDYHEPTNTSNYQVIYSRIKKDAVKKSAPSGSARSVGRPAPEPSKNAGNLRGARRPPPKEKTGGGSIAIPVLAAVLILIAGVAAMLVLQSNMDFGAALGSLVGSKSR